MRLSDSQGSYTWLHEDHDFPMPDKGKATKVVRLGRTAAITQQAQHLYFHWLLECLVRLAVLEPLLQQTGSGSAAGSADDDWIDTLIVPKFGRMAEVCICLCPSPTLSHPLPPSPTLSHPLPPSPTLPILLSQQ
jgi:hypothetical protein